VVAALAAVAAGILIATDSGGSGSPSKADGAKQRQAPTSVPTSSDPAVQARDLADFFRAQSR
ncbi:MAG: hypothetical protein WBQ41_13865, partial [Solirubrobacterales bacterium]